jgi:hypothetical protein
MFVETGKEAKKGDKDGAKEERKRKKGKKTRDACRVCFMPGNIYA